MANKDTVEYIRTVLFAKLDNFEMRRDYVGIEGRKILIIDIFDFCVKNYGLIRDNTTRKFKGIITRKLRGFRREDSFLKSDKYDILLKWK
jgi:hypothetical protein